MTGRWKPGQSGNPAGRPRGLKHRRTLLQEGLLTRDDVEGLVQQLLAAARQGDTTAAGVLLDRVVPKLRPIAQPVEVPVPADGTLTEQARAVFLAAADGRVTVDTASDLIGALASMARLAQMDELQSRIERLEALTHDQR